MPTLGKLASQLGKNILDQKLARVYIEVIDDGSPKDTRTDPRAFQYWPESISESQNVEYAQSSVPGGTLPLYQWVSLGPRAVSFTVYFSRDEDGGINTAGGGALSPVAAASGGGKVGQDKHNVDINGAIAWLRSLYYPAYADNRVYPPQILVLYMPNVFLGGTASTKQQEGSIGFIDCILTNITVDYKAFFPSGRPRIATADLTFNEVAQIPGEGVKFTSRTVWSGKMKETYTVEKSSKK
jgi:hypothetical protein